MLTEPEALLFLARRCGLSIRRDGGTMRVESMNGKPIPGIWAEALKRHKPELMPLLPSVPAQGAKDANPGRPRKPRPTPLEQGQLDLFAKPGAATGPHKARRSNEETADA